MTHDQILDSLSNLIIMAGDTNDRGLIGYGYMRVLETLIEYAQQSTNPLIVATRAGLDLAIAHASTAGGFEVIDVRDQRTDDQICADARARGVPISC